MTIRVAGHQVETGDALQTHVHDKMEAMTEKYFDREIRANVTFGRGPHDDFTCDIVAPVVQGMVLKASARADRAQWAFDSAAGKVERQLAKYMDRLRDRKGNGSVGDLVEDAGYTIFAETPEHAQPENPPVVAETKVDIPDAAVSDAVMMLDLRNTNALMFRNAATGALNMVYRRGDGTIGWVEPQAS